MATLTPAPHPHPPSTPATAVEVVTSLGGSVVSIDTLAHAPTAHHRGRMALLAGAALLSLGIATFFYGVRAARHDARARAAWIADKRPSWAFRPTRHGAAVNALAAIGAIGGLALIVTGLVRRRDAARSRLRVGQNDGVDIPLADAPPELTLVERNADGFVTPLAELDGDVGYAGAVTSLASMRAAGHVAVPLHVGTQVRTRVGQATFFVRGIAAPARSAPPVLGWERAPLAFFAGSAVAHLMVWGLLRNLAPDQTGAPTDLSVREDASSKSYLVSTESIVTPPETGDADDGSEPAGSATAPTATALEDGTLGHDTPNPTPARLKVANRNDGPQLSKHEAMQRAIDAGILGSDVFANPIRVVGGGDLASGFDDMDITGGLFDGDGSGAPAGSFGWGVRGTGHGCGTLTGVPCGGIASDPFATLGKDDGRNYIGTLGGDGPGLKKRPPVVPVVKISTPTVCGGASACLDKEIIRRYIHRNLSKISYCYEHELLASPSLEGTVVANFTLNGNGRVIESRADGVSTAVSTCVAQVISNIQFPKVGDLGVYPIKYPFSMRPRG